MASEIVDRDAVRVLICDDAGSERVALGHILRRQGYEVDEAADGTSAMLMLKGRSYDLLLLDLQMPEVDGFDVLAYVQKQKPDLPVVLLSGLTPDAIGDGLHRIPGRELPSLLIKPIDTEQLFQVIELKLAGELP